MKTYIIYMSGDDFSVKMTEETIEPLEHFNIEYELFDGVVGKKGLDVLKSFDVKPSSVVPQSEWTDGTIGCLASHYLLWQKCANQEEPFMILEQDGLLVRDPRGILPLIDSVCHLDAFLPFENQEKGYDHFEWYNERIEEYEPGVKKYPSNVFYPDNNLTGSVFRGAYGYIMTPKGAKQILNFIKRFGAFPADRCLCERAANIQRANSTYVRLNPFFHSLNVQREFTSRKA